MDEYNELVSHTQGVVKHSQYSIPNSLNSYLNDFNNKNYGFYNQISNLCVNLGGYADNAEKFELIKKMLLVDKATDARRGNWDASNAKNSTEIDDWLAAIYPRLARMVGMI